MTAITFDALSAIIRKILMQKGIDKTGIKGDTSLYEDGIGLDSLDAATLSVLLEKEFGSDPYSLGKFPRTINDILAFYNSN